MLHKHVSTKVEEEKDTYRNKCSRCALADLGGGLPFSRKILPKRLFFAIFGLHPFLTEWWTKVVMRGSSLSKMSRAAYDEYHKCVIKMRDFLSYHTSLYALCTFPPSYVRQAVSIIT